ncbi:MAG: DedA family protein [Epsilonproteobacteria bacterium]|nr:DedA family protein [Campylobacterota bacterium]
MQDIINSLSTYGYIILFLYSFGGGFFALVAAGILSYAGKMDITTSIIVAFIANFIGDSVLFYVARYNKSVVMPYIEKHKRKLALSTVLMRKYGDKIIFFQKFLYGFKTLVPIAIGLTKYDFKKFTVYNLFSALVWALVFGLGSFYSGKYLLELVKFLKNHMWLTPVLMFLLLGGVWLYMEKATKKRS